MLLKIWKDKNKALKWLLFISSEVVVQTCSVKKDVLKNFGKSIGIQLYQSLFFNKTAGLRPVTLLKKRLWHRCFPVNFAKLLRMLFIIKHFWWLLLYLERSETRVKHLGYDEVFILFFLINIYVFIFSFLKRDFCTGAFLWIWPNF